MLFDPVSESTSTAFFKVQLLLQQIQSFVRDTKRSLLKRISRILAFQAGITARQADVDDVALSLRTGIYDANAHRDGGAGSHNRGNLGHSGQIFVGIKNAARYGARPAVLQQDSY